MKQHKHGGDIYLHGDVIDFSANVNPLGTPESVREAVRKSADYVEHYPDVRCGELKKALSSYEQVPKSRLICGNGAADLIFALTLAVKPRHALVLAPTFAEYEQALDSVGCKTDYFYLEETEGFQVTERILSQITPSLDMIFLCNPNNPTGELIHKGFLVRMLEVCRKYHVLLAVDECFLDFVPDGKAYELSGCMEEYANLFLLKAFTKRYAMPGIRLGYGMCSDEGIIKKMEEVTQPWRVSAPAQAAGRAALLETVYAEKSVRFVEEQKGLLRIALTDAGFQVYGSRANYLFFKGRPDFYDYCLKRGFLIRDCSNYRGLCPGWFRIAVRTQEENRRFIQMLLTFTKGEASWLRQ
ncbi:pyridoxal phosphate-dependent aminotransferase [Anaerostipes sp.]|uniref:pyridoxal phosphate-dependent aminotransferase n=1 Tax=Anaerostipes sp. TaxID=1872530 RepID=UPI0025BFDEE1|nr:threonine-phosphate decarboxylase [Anaerostipes sp.]MBS7007386.1 aminotransferase class I/II-fold pyridoxal phosphate-dependent enzyme [Anaerostipes sp.]